ncbi:eukaryotic mitochondrial regulator protein-domain-containing protein [Phlyctochytrium arcticum]|nr:eukaryotic mitochondrial regulator protein-domain-containing protein [Phlyctochytrium arcticum]
MNPLFRPKAPIDNDTRNEIFKLYQQDPKTWTPRRLGDHFGLSIVRVQAILRLRAVASKWESEGKELEEGYRQGMETMLGAQKIKPDANLVPREPLRFTTARRLQPFFRMMNEEEAFTAEDAAALMQLEPYQNLQRKLDLAANRAFSMTPPKQDKDHAAPTVKKDEGQKSRFKFMVVDTSNPRRKELTIRERNGDIRSATVEEKFQRKNAKPTFIM